MGNKRKVTLVVASAVREQTNDKKRRIVINQYHELEKQKLSIASNKSLDNNAKQKATAAIEAEMTAAGGIDSYQKASIAGHTAATTVKFNTSRWVMERVKLQQPLYANSEATNIKLLDVGSLTNHYLPFKRNIACTAIDLNPQHSSVQAIDFFDLPHNDVQHARVYDVIVLSLVLNFVGDKLKRGIMLTRSHKMLKSGGSLFIILPKACMDNSRYMNGETMKTMMTGIGFEETFTRSSSKLVLYEYKAVVCTKIIAFAPKVKIAGIARNNFSISIQ